MNTLNSQLRFKGNSSTAVPMEPKVANPEYAYITQSETAPQTTVLEQNVKMLVEVGVMGSDNIYLLTSILNRLKGQGESKEDKDARSIPSGTLHVLRDTIDRVHTQHSTLFSLLKELETLV